MNFNIVENSDPDYDLETLIQDYQNTKLTVKEVREKHSISNGGWQTVLKVLKEHNVPLRGYRTKGYVKRVYESYSKTNHCYYDKNSGKYKVLKTINNRVYYFGVYPTLSEAEERVNELRESNWEGLL